MNRSLPVVALAILGMAAIVAVTAEGAHQAKNTEQAGAITNAEHEALLADPVAIGQYKVNCASVDAGTLLTDVLVPTDGGTAANPVIARTVYVAPNAGSSVKVRFGGAGLTSSTGFEVGTGAREGAGVSLDAKGPLRCKSEGAAQEADVVVGK